MLLSSLHQEQWPPTDWSSFTLFCCYCYFGVTLLSLVPLSHTKQWSWQKVKGLRNWQWHATNICIWLKMISIVYISLCWITLTDKPQKLWQYNRTCLRCQLKKAGLWLVPGLTWFCEQIECQRHWIWLTHRWHHCLMIWRTGFLSSRHTEDRWAGLWHHQWCMYSIV